MGLRDLLAGRTGALVDLAAGPPPAEPPPPAPDPEARPVATMGPDAAGSELLGVIRADSAASIARGVALSIPAVRKARHVIVGTISTFALSAWAGGRRLDQDDPRASWLRQPDPAKTLQTTLAGTIDDGIWKDRAVWQVLDRSIAGAPVKFRRVAPSRLSVVEDPWDSDLVEVWTIDGAEVPARNIVHFNFAGLGGLERYGAAILELYVDLQVAAGRYAKAPMPKTILKNLGADLTNPEIIQLIADWEARRELSSTAYLNAVMEHETVGWNAQELQLVEGREYAALEVARLFGLPAAALDAKSGDSMTYGNVVEKRRDVLEALRPWMTPVEQTLSLDDRSSRPTGLVVPHGVEVRFDADAYTRDDPETRMRTWQAARAANVLSAAEVRAAEPLATSKTPPPTPATPPPAPPADAANPAPNDTAPPTPPPARSEVPA